MECFHLDFCLCVNQIPQTVAIFFLAIIHFSKKQLETLKNIVLVATVQYSTIQKSLEVN